MFIITVGVSYKTTPVEVRERLAFDNSQLASMFDRLKSTGKIASCVILSTCNRIEIYATSKDADAALSEVWKLLSDKSGIETEQLKEYLYNFTCQQAITHLFKVVSGLDSMILGEMEILGQVARAYQIACENSASNTVLNVLFQKALKLGKQIHTETRISNGASSVGSAAVELTKQVFNDIQDCSILLIGAGETGRLVAQNLANNGASKVMVCNRSYDKAQELATQFNGCVVPFENLFQNMVNADLVVTCTSAPNYIITKEQLAHIMKMRDYKPIVLIDLAVPRNIEPELSQLKNTYLYNIDDLKDIVDECLKERKLEAEKAEKIIENALDSFARWLNNLHTVPVIKAMTQKGEDIRDSELEKAVRKLGPITEREEKILRSMACSITSKMMNTPIVKLKEYANTKQGYLYTQLAMDLFNIPIRVDEQLKDSQIEEQIRLKKPDVSL
ncbi:MAG: glutamyl-tRNA reductase [Candidatus Poribacteria bacterium]